MQEAEVVTRAPIVPGAQAAHGVEPREVALDDPAVAAETVLRLDATPGDPCSDVAHATCAATLPEVVPLVGVHFWRDAAAAGRGPGAARRESRPRALRRAGSRLRSRP